MAANENNSFTEEKDDQKTLSLKRIITVSSDDDADNNEDKESNKSNKRQRSLSLTKIKPSQLMNKQPVIRNTRQTSLSIIRTNSDEGDNEERKWNLKMIASSSSSSNQTLSKQQKKKMTQTKLTTLFKQKPSSPLVRTVSSPSIIKAETVTVTDRTRTVSLDGIDIDEEELFSQWNDQLNTSSSATTTTQATTKTVDSKSVWKQIFGKPVKPKPIVDDDELKEQWSQLDKEQPPSNHRFYNPPAGVKRTCPFYKKIPGTTFCVDAFNFGNIEGIQAYFLSHFHSDHYGGLNKKFSNMLYSNQITCNLCKSQLGVRPENMTILPMNVFTNIHGIDVALIDANHCPGSNMFLFRFPNGKLILHTEEKDDQKTLSLKRIITVSSDDDDNHEDKESNKRQRSLSLTKIKPSQLINKQPVIRNTRQTSLSIIRTNSDEGDNEERKWNLKMIASSSSSNQTLPKQQKKKMTQTKLTTLFKQKPSSPLVRTVSSPSIVKAETVIVTDRTRTVSLDGIDIDEEELFSQWNDQLNTSASATTTTEATTKTVDSKSVWKQIFGKPVKPKPIVDDEELKEQWSQLDKEQPPGNHRFYNPPAGVKRTCPFYKKIPGIFLFRFSCMTISNQSQIYLGTTFCVDAFNFGNIEGIQAYFLSHFHSDHYGGLNKKFSNMLYSNQITCNLCKSQLGVRPENMTILPMNVFTNIHGIDVALIDANQ
ncbi:unnamed protein product [Adineta steineri]|uniref:Uncharacterized protein n=1 Tax=Adineta steineri TaxID=433720 RepID=A0A814AJ62_9BILA|nr:unnamed protein product [Adineta steineri]